jgi:hypothetical protein
MQKPHLSEQEIQRGVIDHLAWRGVPDLFYFHVPLGGYRRPVEAKIFKSLGVVAGIPDLVIICRGHVYALELKAERGPRK